jgi:hypothetical protein
LETIIEAAAWVVSIVLWAIFVPKRKLRDAIISHLFMQIPNWLLGLTVVELGLIKYPVRFLAIAMRSSFTFEFMAFPTVSVIYNIYYPVDRSVWIRLLYIAAFPCTLTVGEIILVNYTQLIEYVHWTWYISWISIALVLQASYWFYSWFIWGSRFRLV